DGVSVKIRDFGTLFGKRVRMTGRMLLAQETEAKGVTLRLYDVVAGKDVWSQTFASGSKILHSENEDVGGIVEPNGKVTVVDLKRHKTVMQASMKAEHIAKAERLVLLKDRRDFFVGCLNQMDPALAPFGGVMSNLFPNTGLRSTTVNGMLYAFDGETGKM